MSRSNIQTAWIIAAMGIGMFCLAYAAVPLYSLFCKITGYGGTPTIVEEASLKQGTRNMKILFNADIYAHMPWKFTPLQREIELVTGTQALAFYGAKNLSSRSVTGTSTYNITPQKAGKYFVKVQCFCFEEQTLNPGQEVDMPVTFYVDPAIEDDPNMDDVKTITLSYTFFEVEKSKSN